MTPGLIDLFSCSRRQSQNQWLKTTGREMLAQLKEKLPNAERCLKMETPAGEGVNYGFWWC